MAHRQLLWCLRCARNSSPPSPLARWSSHTDELSRSYTSSHPLFFSQIGLRLFSAASRHGGGGKSTPSEKVTSAAEKKGMPPPPATPKVAPPITPKAASPITPKPATTQGPQPQSKDSASSPKQSYFMIVAALSAAAIAVVTLYPVDLRKTLHLGQKEEQSFHQKDEQNLEKKANYEEAMVSENHSVDVKDENTSVKPKLFLIDEEKELPVSKIEQESNNNENVETFPPEESTPNVVSDGSITNQQQDHVEEVHNVPSQSATVPRKEQELPGNEIIQQSNITESKEKLPLQDSIPNTFLDGSVNNEVQVHAEDLHKIQTHSAIVAVEEHEPLHEIPEKSEESSKNERKRPSVFEAYHLQHDGAKTVSLLEEELKSGTEPELKHEISIKPDAAHETSTTDGRSRESTKNAFDMLDIVHAAEQRQAEIDAYLYEEALKKIKQVLQEELKDAQAKELMYAEEANRLGKEIEIERERAAADLKLERENAIERLNQELKRKEEETNLKLEKGDLLAKAEITAAIAKEKALYLKDVKDIKQELEALRMVFYARSEEVRHSHTAHKLAVGTFALEDAMKNGAPVEKVINLIFASYGGHDSDPLLDAALSSLPKDVHRKGTKTLSQLHQQFDSMKSAVLELSLIPASGGGFLSHAAAKAISVLKIKEEGKYSDGIDSIVSQVQRCLSDGNLVDAADLIEKSVKGTEAETLVADWVKQARERAVMEQVLLLLQAHATAVASSLA